MSVEDPPWRRRVFKTVAIASAIALVFGVLGLMSPLIGLTFRPIPPMDELLRQAIRSGLNVMAVAFWIIFPIVYVLSLPAEDRSPAAREWERNLRRAEEIFKREKSLGRGSWWR